VLSSKMPYFISAVDLLSYLLPTIAFRSLLVQLTTALMNLFAAGASFGVIVAIFQSGWVPRRWASARVAQSRPSRQCCTSRSCLACPSTTRCSSSAARTGVVHTKSNRRAITVGQPETGGIITAAAIIMIAVFSRFVLGDNRVGKLVGIGPASAIFIDALILRTILLPAMMQLLGRLNWYLPKWLDRITPRMSVEPADDGWDELDAIEPEQPVGAH